MAENSGNQVHSNKHSSTIAQRSYCICDCGVEGELLFDPPFSSLHHQLAERDVVHYSSSVNKHLDQVPGNRLPHNAWLFAARVALMPAVMNQHRLLQQLKGNQIYTSFQCRIQSCLIEAC